MDISFFSLLTQTPILGIIFLIGSVVLTGLHTALQKLGKLQAEEAFKGHSRFFYYFHTTKWLFGEKKWEGLSFSLRFSKHLINLLYAFCVFFFLIFPLFSPDTSPNFLWALALTLLSIFVSLFATVAVDLLALIKPMLFLRVVAPFTSIFLILCAPITLPLFKLFAYFSHTPSRQKVPLFRLRDKILEILDESDLSPYLDVNEQKLILSVVSFKERIVREVMVPRIDVFSLSAETKISEAARALLSERYSRIPVHRDTIDNVIGFLHYKDLFDVYVHALESNTSPLSLEQSIEKFVKPVLYTPETKKISQLLQEFRSRQMHIAIVVDEYGGTEGIVTIEDILEELVGEIGDEYDIGEEVLFSILPSGGWIVDAKMSIIDIEKELSIQIPQSPEYDTIGGYIFHRAGAIPQKGWRIHHDDFDLEVLSSSERSIEKIRITRLSK